MKKLIILSWLIQAISLPLAFAAEGGQGLPKIDYTSEQIDVANTDGNKSTVKIELETIVPRNDQDIEILKERAAKVLSENPLAKRELHLMTTQSQEVATEQELSELGRDVLRQASRLNGSVQSQVEVQKTKVPNSFIRSVKQRVGSAKELFVKHERVTLTIVRGTVNTTVVTLGLMFNAGLSPLVSLAIGATTGGLSGLFQYINPRFQRFINGDPEKNKRIIERSRFGKMRVKITQLSKWLATEVALYSIIDGIKFAVGVPMEGPMKEALKVLKSSTMAMASQGVWESTLAENTSRQLDRAGQDQAERAKIQFRSNVMAFGISMASVFGGVLSLAGSSLGTWSLGVLGVTGIAYTIKSWRKNRQTAQANQGPLLKFSSASRCRSVFR